MRLSGTSMATPHVAGVVALLLEANPELTPAEVRTILTTTATDMAIEGHEELLPGFDLASGHGLVNVRKALAMAVGAPVTDSCPAATPTTPVTPVTPPPAPPAVTPVTPAPAVTEGRFGGGAFGLGLLVLLMAAGERRRRRG